MANRNTRIRGVQVLYNTIDENHLTTSVAGDGLAGGNGSALSLDLNELTGAVVDVANDSIAIVDANDGNASRKETVADVITAVAGVGLSATAGVLAVDLNEVGEVAVDVSADSFALTDNSDSDATKRDTIADLTKRDTIADLMTAVAGTGLTATDGVLSVDEHASGIITEDDIVRNEVVEPDTGSDTDYTLANTPVAGTVNIYLNGLLQQPGTGEDYTIDGASIVFATAVDASDLVLADYIIT